MGTTAPQENPKFAAPSEEGGVRAAILDAARSVARREGVIEMTLTAVAREASVAATDIYAFFTSKNDLLQAVVADDLATLAKTMRQSLGDPSGATDASLAADAIPAHPVANEDDRATDETTESSQSQYTQVSPMQAAGFMQAETPAPASAGEKPGKVPSAPLPETPRRYPVVQTLREASRAAADANANAGTADAIARLQEAVAKLETTPVDQWLERRLREFERTLYALQHNQNHRASSNAVEHGLQSLRESVEAIDMRHSMVAEEAARASGERFDVVDRRLREMLSDLQAETVHLAKRITALENLAFASRPEQMAPAVEAFAPIVAPEPVLDLTQEAPEAIVEAGQESPARDGNEATPSFLMAARRSAAEAAAHEESRDLRQKPPAPKANRTMLYATCGVVALFVVLLAGLGFMFRDAAMNAPAVHLAAKATPARVVRAVAAKRLQQVVQKAAPQTNLLKLAHTGDASAELLVGLEYLEGKGVAKNDAMAVDWLSRAAAKGQPVAQYDLGALYADGRGVHADPVQAFQWFGSAALRGNRRAMHFLAIAYAEGVGTTKDLPEAARWFERAANLGAVNSQFNLAVLYERGLGVPQSLTTAYTWYAIAARQGDHESQARVAALSSTLKPDDLASAKSAADVFKPQPLDAAANLPPKLPS